MKKRYAAILAIAALAVPVGIAEAKGGDDSPPGCSPGEWVHAKVTKANGESLRSSVHAELPPGHSIETWSGSPNARRADQKIIVNADGSVEARGGEVVVECIAPTH